MAAGLTIAWRARQRNILAVSEVRYKRRWRPKVDKKMLFSVLFFFMVLIFNSIKKKYIV